MDQKLSKPPDDPDSFNSQIQSPELWSKLIKLARKNDVSIDDCEDIVSEAIARGIAHQEEYDPSRGAFFSWISGITENVIRSYYRKLKAQKRQPKGGLVSLQALRDNDHSQAEPKDSVAEEKSKLSEELKHYIDTAKLSEKEDSAIANHVNKQPNRGGARFSSSTARRAKKKLKQVASDEKFRQSPQGPEASECAYGRLPNAEHDAALLYDALRRTTWFVNAIDDWRKSPTWNDVQTYLKNERGRNRFPLVILPEHWPKQLSHYRDAAHQRDPVLRRRFEAAIDIAVAFPKWPEVSYCQIEPMERRQCLEQFGWTFGPEPFWDIDKRTFEFFVNAADEKLSPPVSLGAFLKYVNQAPYSGSHAYSSTHLVRVDWRYPLKTIVESFKKWAASKQNLSTKKIAQTGRSRTTRLVGFACIRLIEDFHLTNEQAMSWLKERFGAPIPSTPERLERAVRTARDSLKDFLPSPAEIGT